MATQSENSWCYSNLRTVYYLFAEGFYCLSTVLHLTCPYVGTSQLIVNNEANFFINSLIR